jgi:VanZ family protein
MEDAPAIRPWIHRGWQILAGIYVVVLSWMMLAPQPWIIFGKQQDSVPLVSAASTLPDYLQHLGAFMLLACLAQMAVRGGPVNRLSLRASLLVGYALFVETAHTWIPQRTFQWSDLIANLAGVLLGIVISQTLEKRV